MGQGLQQFVVIGAGAWGTALATTLRRAGRDVALWSRNPELTSAIHRDHENKAYLPGVAIDPVIKATADFKTLQNADIILFATPAQHFRRIAREAKASGFLKGGLPVIIACKGIELTTSKLMSDVAVEEMAGHPIAILSGPCFAHEVAGGKLTALTLALPDARLGEAMAHAIATATFRPYLSDDVIGAQLGGAIKNVLAIASGILVGKQLGENARAAMITRGLAEMMRLSTEMGARSETLMGLSGLGDLLLTCSSPQSRNMSLGIALGEGRKLEDILKERTTVAEGVPTAAAALSLAQKHKVDMPIVAAMTAILEGNTGIDEAVAGLMARPLKTEIR